MAGSIRVTYYLTSPECSGAYFPANYERTAFLKNGGTP